MFSLWGFFWKPLCLPNVSWKENQASSEYDTFLVNFEQLLTYLNSWKPGIMLVTGNFSAKPSSWWFDDINTIEGTNLN